MHFIHRKYGEYLDRDVCFVRSHLQFMTWRKRFFVCKKSVPDILNDPFSYKFIRDDIADTPEIYNGFCLWTVNETHYGLSILALRTLVSYNLTFNKRTYIPRRTPIRVFIEMFNG